MEPDREKRENRTIYRKTRVGSGSLRHSRLKDDSIRENDSFTSRGVANLESAADLKGS